MTLFLAILHFRHHLEGRHFTAWTDHKPLCGALSSSVDRSPRQTRQLSFIAEFTTDIRHVPGSSNVVADLLSRPPSPSAPAPDRPAPGRTFAQVAAATNPTTPSLATPVDWLALSREQYRCRAEFQNLRGDSSHLKLQLVAIPGSEPPARILCDVSTGINRPLVPASRKNSYSTTFTASIMPVAAVR